MSQLSSLASDKAIIDQKKSERLEAWISRDMKERLKQAATLSHKSLNDFIVHTLMEKANKIIQENNLLKLSTRDSEIFSNSLLSPPNPNSKLKQAIKKYKSN